MSETTIAAIATAPGKGAVGIVRISGPKTPIIAEAILKTKPLVKQVMVATFYDPKGQPIDHGIALYFQAPHSFTGEHVLELQAHGGVVVLNLLLETACQLGAVLAKPGEFSERGFLNGKIDLLQAEAIADLIDATSAQAARSALRSLQGEFSKKINELVEQVIKLRIFVEAAIDFPEEEIDFLSDDQISKEIFKIKEQLENILYTAKQGTRLTEGFKVVLIGPPNAGKSSLLNRLAGEEKAIVTAIPGTTRDIVEVNILINGVPVQLIDTAGMRETNDLIEQEGIRRAKQQLLNADCILMVVDAKTWRENATNILPQLLAEEVEKTTLLINKVDLLEEHIKMEEGLTLFKEKAIFVSAKTGYGLGDLTECLQKILGVTENSESVYTARTRHIQALQQAKQAIFTAEKFYISRQGELLAEELKATQKYLATITGEFTSDDLLGRIFSEFCIGK